MKCSQCSDEATYYRNPDTGKQSTNLKHAFCSQCWEDAMRRASTEALRNHPRLDQARQQISDVQSIMRRIRYKNKVS